MNVKLKQNALADKLVAMAESLEMTPDEYSKSHGYRDFEEHLDDAIYALIVRIYGC